MNNNMTKETEAQPKKNKEHDHKKYSGSTLGDALH